MSSERPDSRITPPRFGGERFVGGYQRRIQSLRQSQVEAVLQRMAQLQ